MGKWVLVFIIQQYTGQNLVEFKTPFYSEGQCEKFAEQVMKKANRRANNYVCVPVDSENSLPKI